MDSHLGIVGARLNTDVAATTAGFEFVFGKCRELDKRVGSMHGDAEPVTSSV